MACRRAAPPLPAAILLALLAVNMLACRQAPPPKQYELTGQILSIKPERNEVVVRHDDIKGFMPAMTMPYKVRDPQLLSGRMAGDLITATLTVEPETAWISAMTATGHAPLPAEQGLHDSEQALYPRSAALGLFDAPFCLS